MSWHYSQALVEAFSAACSSAGALSVQWRSMPSAPDDSCSDKMKGTCHRSPFGMMFVPSTDAHGEALLTWFREASLARTSAQQTATVQESTAKRAVYGESLRGSFARYDQSMSSWRTAQISLLGASDECLETWPRWGQMEDGACYPQKPLEHGTCESGSGLLPTLRATDRERGGRGDLLAVVKGRPNKHCRFPTLTANDCKPAGKVEVMEYRQENRRTTVQRLRSAVTEPEQLGGTLNPDWCEWFMGWPIGWTASEPLETDKFQQWLLGHGRYCMTTNTDRVQPAYRPDTDPVEGGASTSSPLWTCPDCDGVGRIAERKDDIYCCPEHQCELCGGTGSVTDLKAAVWGEDAARDHK